MNYSCSFLKQMIWLVVCLFVCLFVYLFVCLFVCVIVYLLSGKEAKLFLRTVPNPSQKSVGVHKAATLDNSSARES